MKIYRYYLIKFEKINNYQVSQNYNNNIILQRNRQNLNYVYNCCNQIIDNNQLEPSLYRIRSNNRNNIDRALKNWIWRPNSDFLDWNTRKNSNK